ncbi:integral membrane sensor signal transduction histidine kinase [Thermodesulfatator indicus DSM 15286]|uniref:histidine kinase n=1 Tax=Thermodesulfatator indicus (strain DSM 15286 / JCM 11887 / CIR29812) TaxID=667014 RepID=F8ABU3_THEID|nr:HAMP domain-containing sensor histidine kinase [Thermodesulfatator indicus]AEH44552.1 integral membrane sensor signal transduction histidine kinase [Thermodesulfatator indicus DSM 15286]
MSQKILGYKTTFFLAIGVLILAIVIEGFYFRHFLDKSMAREARSTLNFLKARLTAYVETIALLPDVPDYLKDLAWLTDELQGQPQLVGVLVKEKGKILLNTFPQNLSLPETVFKSCYQGFNRGNVRYVCQKFEALPDREFFLLLGLDIKFAHKAFANFIFLSACILIAGTALLASGLFYLEKFARRQKELEEKLLASEKLAAMGKMSAMVAHEIRNPLNSIVMGLQYMSETRRLSPEIIDMIKNEAQKLTELTGELFSYTRGFETRPQKIDVLDVIEELEEKFREKIERLSLTFIVEKGPSATIWIDKRWCLRALENLLHNAIEATPAGGTIELGYEILDKEVCFYVKDSGEGVSFSVQNKLFEPFFTTKENGFGLGLYLVRKVAEAHGGRVSFISKPKEGTVFKIYFPKAHE